MNVIKNPISYLLTNSSASLWWETSNDAQGDGSHGLWVYESGKEPYFVRSNFITVSNNYGELVIIHTVYLSNIVSGLFSVRIAAPGYLGTEYFSFVCLESTADIHAIIVNNTEGDYSKLSQLNTVTTSTNVVFSCGGLIDKNSLQTYSSWENLYNNIYPIWKNKFGVVSARSYYDSYGLGSKYYPVSNGSFYFASSVGSTRVVCLDTSINGRKSLISDQKDWLSNETNSPDWKNSLYRVILCQNSFKYSMWTDTSDYGDNGVDKFLYKYLYPLLRKAGPDLVITGGSHAYQRGATSSTNSKYPGLPIYILTCGGLSSEYNYSLNNDTVDPVLFVQESAPHYVVIKTTNLNMNVTARYLSNGSVIDSVAIPAKTL